MAVKIVTHEEIRRLITQGLAGNQQALAQAENILNHIINREPWNDYGVFTLAEVYLHTDRCGLAVNLLDRVAQTQPNNVAVYNNKGNAYRREHLNAKAASAFARGLELAPDDADLHNNMATLHINEGSPEQAEKYLERAVALKPAHRHAHWNLGLAKLEMEKFEDGFREYVWGLSTNDRQLKNYGPFVRWWHGEKNANVVIYDEQGVGDSVMFASMIEEVAKDQKWLVYDCHPRLESIMSRSFAHLPNVIVKGTRKEMDAPEWMAEVEAQIGKIQYKAPIATAAVYYRKSLADFPGTPYLKPNRELVARYKSKLEQSGSGPFIGVSLYGGHKRTRKDQRCVDALTDGLPIMQLPATLVSLEYTDREEEFTALEKQHGIKVVRFRDVTETTKDDWYEVWHAGECKFKSGDKYEAKAIAKQLDGSELKHIKGPAFDLDHHMALMCAIAELDGSIVTVNQSNVWFAGALGLPCYVLTPHACAWRYGRNREDCYWFDSIAQFRQGSDKSWREPVARLVKAVSGVYWPKAVEDAA